jgi:hypothetical protein
MSIVRRTWPRVEEFWFDEPVPERGVDVALLYQRATIAQLATSSNKHTLAVDLTRTSEQLLAEMHPDTRYKIRRAQARDALDFQSPACPDEAQLQAFHAFFARFASDKRLPAVSLQYLRAANTAGALRLSGMAHQGEALVWHTHLVIGQRARLWHSASQYRGQDTPRRNLIGRANRLLHWLEMQSFRASGATLYDFGGWYAGQDDEQRLRINRFKEGFGGTRRCEAEGALALTWLGSAYLFARKWRA